VRVGSGAGVGPGVAIDWPLGALWRVEPAADASGVSGVGVGVAVEEAVGLGVRSTAGAGAGATPGAGADGAEPTATLVVVPAGSVTLMPPASVSTVPSVATMIVSPFASTATNDPEPARMTDAIAALCTS